MSNIWQGQVWTCSFCCVVSRKRWKIKDDDKDIVCIATIEYLKRFGYDICPVLVLFAAVITSKSNLGSKTNLGFTFHYLYNYELGSKARLINPLVLIHYTMIYLSEHLTMPFFNLVMWNMFSSDQLDNSCRFCNQGLCGNSQFCIAPCKISFCKISSFGAITCGAHVRFELY